MKFLNRELECLTMTEPRTLLNFAIPCIGHSTHIAYRVLIFQQSLSSLPTLVGPVAFSSGCKKTHNFPIPPRPVPITFYCLFSQYATKSYPPQEGDELTHFLLISCPPPKTTPRSNSYKHTHTRVASNLAMVRVRSSSKLLSPSACVRSQGQRTSSSSYSYSHLLGVIK